MGRLLKPVLQDNSFWKKNARFVGEIFASALAKSMPFFGSKIPAMKIWQGRSRKL
jgi:hypothetical protein